MNTVQRFLRWWDTRKLAIAGIAFILLVLVIVGESDIRIPPPVRQMASGAVTEFIGILFTVAVLDWLNDRRATQLEKTDLILQMGSPDNAFAREAVRKLRVRGWGFGEDRSLRDANLNQADLHGADLMKANLEMVNLTRANLQGANLIRSNLKDATLILANLQDADLFKVDLRGADLSRAFVTDSQIADASCLWGATMQDGSRYDGRFNLTGDIEHARKSGLDVEDPEVMSNWYAKRSLGRSGD